MAIWASLMIAASATSCAAEAPRTDDYASFLVAAATGEGRSDEIDVQYFAMRELRILGLTGCVSSDALIPLVAFSRMCPERCRIPLGLVLAAGGPGTDEMVLADMRSVLDAELNADDRLDGHVLALALAKSPSPQVTEELAKLTAGEEFTSYRRMLWSLALAARQDKSRDWLAEVTEKVRGPAPESKVKPYQYDAFLRLLCYAAPTLEPRPALLDALWQLAERRMPERLLNLTWEARLGLISYVSLVEPPLDPTKAEVLSKLADKPPAPDWDQVIARLVLARWRIDPEANVRKALPAFAAAAWSEHGSYFSLLVMDLLVDERIEPYVQKALSSPAPEVRLGAVEMALGMGPRASFMLPELERLLYDKEVAIAKEASRARLAIVGLKEQWESRQQPSRPAAQAKHDETGLVSAAADGDAADIGERMYPVCFKRNTKMKCCVKVIVAPAAAFAGVCKIRGDGTENLDIPPTTATIQGTEATISNVECPNTFVNYVRWYAPLAINWEISRDGGTTWLGTMRSENEVFVTLDTPQCAKRFRTVLYLATKNGGTDPDTCVTNTWNSFAGPANVCAWNEDAKTYTRKLYYYHNTTGDYVTTAAGLLAGGNGQCHAWAELLKECLLANKVTDAKRTRVTPFAGYKRFGVRRIAFDDEDPSFPEDAPWLYSASDLDALPPPDGANGIPGQNMETPMAKLFACHFLVHRAGAGTFYDPSYGVGTTGASDYSPQAMDAWEATIGGSDHWRKRSSSPLVDCAFSPDEDWPE
jgi:hypothetical protein